METKTLNVAGTIKWNTANTLHAQPCKKEEYINHTQLLKNHIFQDYFSAWKNNYLERQAVKTPYIAYSLLFTEHMCDAYVHTWKSGGNATNC